MSGSVVPLPLDLNSPYIYDVSSPSRPGSGWQRDERFSNIGHWFGDRARDGVPNAFDFNDGVGLLDSTRVSGATGGTGRNGWSEPQVDKNGKPTGGTSHFNGDGSPAGTSFSGGHGEGYTPSGGREKNEVKQAERSESGGRDCGKRVLLDLHRDGIEITGLSKSTQFFYTVSEKLLHGTGWAQNTIDHWKSRRTALSP
jgi:hypothetical protein